MDAPDEDWPSWGLEWIVAVQRFGDFCILYGTTIDMWSKYNNATPIRKKLSTF